ncbi:hypothetical protein [Roseinatronobacter alkalisoli]|uniref:Uncharacterized protein n=1 Tax=Roseinatronobacter alkalisoli TaxID=3028235 RepID=A0ABT5TDU7_9RHOB|nr:hypothetical protein [Roseinatronobacter sp. HJB301]MDD7973191.1 hypothetical protein [Roseinatronobacter sp. HJB301]
MVRLGSIAWLFVSLIAAGLAGYVAYGDAEKFAVIVDLLATIISILIGVSLAVIAVLTSPFSVSENAVGDKDEAARMTKLVKNDDETLASGQLMFFWIYFCALALALLFNWTTAGDTTDYSKWYLKILACVTASVGVFAFMWSARLPLMLQRISRQRRTLG